MTKYTIQVTNNETNEVQTLESEGHLIFNVSRREDDGFMNQKLMNELTMQELAVMIDNFEDDNPEFMLARVIHIAAKEMSEKGPTEGCDCEVCRRKREEQAKH